MITIKGAIPSRVNCPAYMCMMSNTTEDLFEDSFGLDLTNTSEALTVTAPVVQTYTYIITVNSLDKHANLTSQPDTFSLSSYGHPPGI